MTFATRHLPESKLAALRLGVDAAVESVAARLRALADGDTPPPFVVPERSTLRALARVFNVDDAELELICAAAGYDIDPAIGDAIEAINGTGVFDVALAARLAGPRVWDILCPEAPLRRWRLIELAGNGPLRQKQIRLDERILHALLGTTYLDARLDGLLQHTALDAPVGAATQGLVRALIEAWSTGPLPLVLLAGRDRLSKRAIAAAAARELGILLYRIRAADIPSDWTQRSALAVLLDRELALSGAAVLIEADRDSAPAAATLADLITGPTIVAAEEPPVPDRTPRLRLELAPPAAGERREIWQRALGDKADAIAGDDLERLAAQFAIDAPAIAAAAATLIDSTAPAHTRAQALWDAARAQGRRTLDGLAERIDSHATWDDLVLPADQLDLLHDLAGHVREAWRVNDAWGWAARSERGLGAAALFAGPSGTGKTLAAEVLAGELRLDLYRIDLSQVVSKYIGETEKNLARIFNAAEDGGAILLFDEADALFGKRSEVKDSHDRYANVEVSYLLQRMEAYRGLAILTTNLKSALDTAFLRRLRYVVTFPFPDAAARAEVWKRVFPPQTPREDLDPSALAKLNVSGGSIRSIALNAAYLAAAVPEPVKTSHIRRAARREYAKLEKPFTASEQEAFR